VECYWRSHLFISNKVCYTRFCVYFCISFEINPIDATATMHRLGADNTTDLNTNVVVYYETYLFHLTFSCQETLITTSNNTNPSQTVLITFVIPCSTSCVRYKICSRHRSAEKLNCKIVWSIFLINTTYSNIPITTAIIKCPFIARHVERL